MSTTQKKLMNPAQLTASPVTYYTAPGSTNTTITNCLLVNTTSSVVIVTLYVVPSGGSASTTNQAVYVKVPANSQRNVFELVNATLSAGDTFEAEADTATAVSLHLSGKETVV